jgi:hypothetical protein
MDYMSIMNKKSTFPVSNRAAPVGVRRGTG